MSNAFDPCSGMLIVMGLLLALLASALAGGLNYPHSPSVLPMLPNAMLSAQSPFHNSIPICMMTGLGDGMSEGSGVKVWF